MTRCGCVFPPRIALAIACRLTAMFMACCTSRFIKGIFGSSRIWRMIAYTIIGKRVLKRYFGREPEIIDVSRMKGDNHWMEIRTYDRQSRRARRRSAG